MDRALVLSERKDARLVHATCRACGASTVALMAFGEAGGSTVGLVTDLSHDDVLRFHGSRRVSTDDVIEAHEAFREPLSKALGIIAPKRRSRAKARVRSRRAA
jgi:hypothetical protein